MESSGKPKRWRLFGRSKKKKKKGQDVLNDNNRTSAVSCGTSTVQAGANNNNHHLYNQHARFFSQSSLDENGSRVPAYLQPHPTGYLQPVPTRVVHNYDEAQYVSSPGNNTTSRRRTSGSMSSSMGNIPRNSATRGSINNLSVVSNSDSTAPTTCIQRSKSQPSVACSPQSQRTKGKKEQRADSNKKPTGGDEKQKKKGLGSWLRKSLKRSKSKNDVSSKERRREAQEALDSEEYGQGATRWHKHHRLSRSVSTSMVNTSSHSSSMSNLVSASGNANATTVGLGRGRIFFDSHTTPLPPPPVQQRHQQMSIEDMHGSPVRVITRKGQCSSTLPQPHTSPSCNTDRLPQSTNHSSLLLTPSQTHQEPEPPQRNSSIGIMRPNSEGHNDRTYLGGPRFVDDVDGGINNNSRRKELSFISANPQGSWVRITPSGDTEVLNPKTNAIRYQPKVLRSACSSSRDRLSREESKDDDTDLIFGRKPSEHWALPSTPNNNNVQYHSRSTLDSPPPLPSKTRNSQGYTDQFDIDINHNGPTATLRSPIANGLQSPGGGLIYGEHKSRAAQPNVDMQGRNVGRSKAPDLRPDSRSSKAHSRSGSRSSDCPSGLAPTPSGGTHPGGGRSPTVRPSPEERSTAFVLIGPTTGARSGPDSPVRSLSLASSVVSSVGVRRVSRELPPIPTAKRHSLASTIMSSTTASESVYHQINDANVISPDRAATVHGHGTSGTGRRPAAPWSPPTMALHSRTTSADILDRPDAGNDSRYGRRSQALVHEMHRNHGQLSGTLKRAASQSTLDQVKNGTKPSKKDMNPFFSQLEHVRSACDLTMITEDVRKQSFSRGKKTKSRSHGKINLRSPSPPQPPPRNPLVPSSKSNLHRRSKSHHDLAAVRSSAPIGGDFNRNPGLHSPSQRCRDSNDGAAGSRYAQIQRHRSQPDFGGPGIQSRESVAFKPLSHTTSDSDSTSVSSVSSEEDDSDDGERNDSISPIKRNRKLSSSKHQKSLSAHKHQYRKRRRRPKRRSASYNNIRDIRDADDDLAWPTLQRRAESSYMLRRWWATMDDIPSAVLRNGKQLRNGRLSRSSSSAASSRDDLSDQDVSMATTASYIPGVSLADKLRLAASKGQIDKVKELIAAGANFTPDREGRTALHYAALNGYANVVSLLAAEGCEIDFQDTLGYTALHRAAAQGHLEVVRALLAEGCLVDRQDEVHGNAALHEAAWNGYSKTLELLVKQRSHVNITNKAGFSALHLAAQNGHNMSARVLLYASTNPDHKNNYGDTPLHTAARYGHAGVTRILCSAKANVNQQNKNGDTALHIAAALKRRKITKLLCDSPIDVNIRNKQNESAVDVARRKEHPEIILIVTSKPRVKEKKGRFGRSKATKASAKGATAEGGEKKEEKRGFFFRRKKVKEKLEVQRSNPALTAASEISSTHYNPSQFSTDPFRDHRRELPGGGGGGGASSSAAAYGTAAQARGTSTLSGAESVTGVMHQYAQKQGVKYYRDLAGNVKQGPVGFTPQCSCAPLVKRLETRVEADRANLYDHIDASHRMLGERVEHLDRRTAQQVYSIDKLTKERLEAERKERAEQLENRALAERLETERQLELQQDCIRTELKAWVDARLTGFERQHLTSHDDGCDFMLTSDFNFGRDGLHTTNLFRSRSDETLSVSSSHPGRTSRKLGGSKAKARAAHELKKMQKDAHQRQSQAGRYHSGLKVHDDRPTGGDGKLRADRGASNKGRPLGHSPEGQSTKNDSFTEQPPPPDRPLPEWMRPSPAVSTPRHFDEAEGLSYNSGVPALNAHMNALHLSPVVNESQISDINVLPTMSPAHPNFLASPIGSPQHPHHHPHHNHHHSQQQPFTILAQVHHAKTDSGSNPDSGYGGKASNPPGGPGGRLLNQSGGGGSDQHDLSLATNVSTTTEGTSASDLGGGGSASGGDPLHVTRHFFDTVSAQMEKWYERRLKEVEKKTEDRVKQESSAMQSRIRMLEERFDTEKNTSMSSSNTSSVTTPTTGKNKVRLGPQIEASIGTQV